MLGLDASALEGTGVSPALTCTDVTKSFGGVPVLRGISLSLQPGTVTALAGENGAGKSTLMKIASGLYSPDQGTVYAGYDPLPHGNAHAATLHGVAIVPQELASINDLTVYENLYLGREPRTKFGTLNRKTMITDAQKALETFGVDINPSARMGNLPVGLRQIVEIVKATSRGAKVLLLDEPTSAIAKQEVAKLVDVVDRLRKQGVAMLFTTHKMEEIRAMADRVVVLRDGRLIVDEPLEKLTDEDIVTAMIGRELENLFPDLPGHSDETVLELDGVRLAGSETAFNFTVRRGEILGLAGLVGAGRTELLEAIFGVRHTVEGTITVKGKQLKRNDPRAAIDSGVALVPEDRKGAGAILSLSVTDNASLPRIGSFTRFGLINEKKRSESVKSVMSSVALRSRGMGQVVETLSGGNQQKVVLGRWLTGPVDVLLLDEPTRGVDVGARSEIYDLIVEMASRGMAVIMASSDMPEILALCHRAYVLRDGAVAGTLTREELASPSSQDRIFRLASGQEINTNGGQK
jgi:ribose transport system ATP-binding protein